MISVVYNEDNMIGMARYPDKYFDLAIVDPPYGIKESAHRNISRSKLAKTKNYRKEIWDQNIPTKEYFAELFRVSKNQIIWGINYFTHVTYFTPGRIVWYKDNGSNDFSDCELAFQSFSKTIKFFEFKWMGMLQGNMKDKEIRIHPTQKPVALYKWTLNKFAKEGDKILDTHVGSGSSRIAADKGGYDFTGFEIDKEYYDLEEKRYKNYKAQLSLAI